MDFDSVITFLFIIAFFVLPSIIKQVLARKKKSSASGKVKETFGIIGKAGEKIRQFIRELEEQARQQRQEGKNQENVWNALGEDENPSPVAKNIDTGADSIETPIAGSRTKRKPERSNPHYEKRTPSRQAKQESSMKEPVDSFSKDLRLKSDPLQNAVVWSEILSKPLALRKKW